MISKTNLWFLACIGILSVTCGFGAEKSRPVKETSEKLYWEKVHAEQRREKEEEERKWNEHREALKASLPQIIQEASTIQPELIRVEDGLGPLLPPSLSLFERYPLQIGIGFVGSLIIALTWVVLARHRREAEIRALTGGYLSDGTEAARFAMPAVFSSRRAQDADEIIPTVLVGGGQESVIRDPVHEFFTEVPAKLEAVRKALQEFARAASETEAQKVLTELGERVTALREQSNLREVQPVWQMSSALELLVKRVTEKPKDATPSVVRTMSAAVELLGTLCAPGIRSNLVVDPPVRILAVDDEPLCLRALTFALQKASVTPDTAENGQRALTLASENAYDVIFMDIQMPEMDGLTACGRIRQTELNAETPVVFVTSKSDFETRSLSNVFGGSDLMAKPFLILELTVKAMTFVMRKRLAQESAAKNGSGAELSVRSIASQGTATQLPVAASSDLSTSNNVDTDASDLTGDFFSDVTSYLVATRRILSGVSAASESGVRQEGLQNIHARISNLSAKAKVQELEIVPHLSSTLEALLRKLHQNPKTITESTLNTIGTALNVLDRLCVPGAEQKLEGHPPIRILVVEDEPLARRAIVGALQLAFEKPQSAGNGSDASALAEEKLYDVIFTDVQMPVVDGYEFCRNVRAGVLNRSTPVLFITNYTDLAVQAHAMESGASDFIGKPFLPIEITVKALTFAWDGRLRKIDAGASPSAPLPVAPKVSSNTPSKADGVAVAA